MSATMLRTAILAAAATCAVGVRKNREVDVLADNVGTDQASEGPSAEKWCTLEEHTLSCGEGTVIKIDKAQYNRQRTTECNPPMTDAAAGANCDVTVTDSLAEACNKRQECNVPVEFHSSCPLYPFSYIRARFECVQGAAPREERQQVAPTTSNEERVPVLPSEALPTTTMPAGPDAPLRRYSKFSVWIKTSDELWSGTDDSIYAKLMGEGGASGWHKLDYFFQNDFERSSLQVYHVTTATPIAATVVCLMKKKAGFWNDNWRPALVKVYEDETSVSEPKIIGSADGWGWFSDENPVCEPLQS